MSRALRTDPQPGTRKEGAPLVPAQWALLCLLHSLLGTGHFPSHTVFRSDNSASESASWKGLTTPEAYAKCSAAS